MADQLTIARPYAQAIFNQAVADGRLEQWLVVLQGLALIVSDTKMKALFEDPEVSTDQINALIYDTLKQACSDAVIGLADKLKNTLSLLAEEKRLVLAPEVEILFHRLLADHQKRVELDVYSAVLMDEAQQAEMIKAMEKRFDSKVTITFHEDKTLIGGALVRSGNWVLDNSIRGKMARLEELLTQ